MRERPILFSAPMVRALLEGRKTQTRRVVKSFKHLVPALGEERDCIKDVDGLPSRLDIAPNNWECCPYGVAGDRLWVRETFAQWHGQELFSGRPWPLTAYRAGRSWINGNCPGYARGETFWEAPDDKPEDVKWRPSIFMPRSASRILLEVTDVRVQRVQDISEADSLSEGIDEELCRQSIGKSPLLAGYLPTCAFAYLWDSINATRGFGWDANPWVWVIEFKRVEQ